MISLILLNEKYFISKDLKSKIYRFVETIEDENTLQIVMEDVAYYVSDKDVAGELTKEQLKELDEAISEADKNETMDWNDFRKEMNE